MSETSQEIRRALTEKRGAELEKWWAINFVRFMKFQDPISPTLSDMPTEILVQVLDKLDSMEQLTCRKVCRSLRSTVEKFGIHFDSISFDVFNTKVTMKLGGFEILYNDAASFNDLRILLKRVRKFEFTIYGEDKHVNATFILNILKANQCVHVKELMLDFVPLNDMCSILPYFDSQMLESIALICDDTNDNFEQLAQLEQWKNAKDCAIHGSLGDNIPIQHLLHFKSFNVDMD